MNKNDILIKIVKNLWKKPQREFQYFGHNSYGAAEKMVEILLN